MIVHLAGRAQRTRAAPVLLRAPGAGLLVLGEPASTGTIAAAPDR